MRYSMHRLFALVLQALLMDELDEDLAIEIKDVW